MTEADVHAELGEARPAGLALRHPGIVYSAV
jgi:hypothetical protein